MTAPTTPDNTAQSWRDLADQLTPEQIARFERLEQRCESNAYNAFADERRAELIAEIRDGMLTEARWEAEQNLTDQHMFGHIPLPAGVSKAEHWEEGEDGQWTRLLSASIRCVSRGGAESSVYISGVQASDGATEWSLYALADDKQPMTGAQAREYASLLLAAADDLDQLTA